MKTTTSNPTPRASQLFVTHQSSSPKEALKALARHMQSRGISYDPTAFTLEDVTSKKRGNCLSLSLLATELLVACGKSPRCRILVRPMDSTDRADGRLFRSLMQGEYFDYDRPTLPKPSDRSRVQDRIHRFASLMHPVVTLEGVPFETTLTTERGEDPLILFPAESSIEGGPELLTSFSLSDRAKVAFALKGRDEDLDGAALERIRQDIEESLRIFPDNRDALALRFRYGRAIGDRSLQEQAEKRLVGFGPTDSDMSYKLWCITGDARYLDIALEQFPQHISAFLERKVFLEKDPREARMNLAVALWCINYSSMFSLETFMKDPGMRQKVKELFPSHR